MKTYQWIALLLGLMILNGCASMQVASLPSAPKPGDPEFAPVPSDSLMPPPNSGGSLFADAYGMSLYGDKKARRVGDIITVLLDESTQGKKSSASKTSKTSEASLTAPSLNSGNFTVDQLGATLQGDRSFSGKGDADQSNSLSGNITVTVSEVLPNGVLRVRGEKWITLNTGSEFIRIQGMLRPDDINLDNTVSSQKLADARIAYSGSGAVANSSKQGWLSAFFNSAIFPF
ncbi:MAG: flagellar basal body L-ring protein FlgH [Reinekea sp.]|nr:flagellar basal body L-ring protein FlgH [Reinekea sp.]